MLNKRSKKLLITLICAVLITVVAGGATVAYLRVGTPPVENTFDPVYVSCKIEETFDGISKTDVKVRNTSDIDAYVRAMFVVMWRADDGTVYSEAPVINVDYSLVLDDQKWKRGTDGYYYYPNFLLPDIATLPLILSLSPISEPPSGYTLYVHVAATAIQATPTAAVEDAWGVSVSGSDGTLIVP